jgi:hypothetical protein
MDGPLAQSLGMEPINRSLITGTPPKPASSPIVSTSVIKKVGYSSMIVFLGTLWVYYSEFNKGSSDEYRTTMVPTSLIDITTDIYVEPLLH